MTSLLLLPLVGCDRDALDVIPPRSTDYPGVIEIGQVSVAPIEEWNADRAAAMADYGYMGTIGAVDVGVVGGVTYSFLGTGERVCLIVDPEHVFWAQSISPQAPNPLYAYPDNVLDDGDLDLFAGLSAYYNGSPGVQLGDFREIYTDSLGNQVEIDFQECTQLDLFGDDQGHAGRASVEYCTIDTGAHPVGVPYTVVLKQFSLPTDDGALSFGTVVVGASCSALSAGIDECTIQGERPRRDGESEEAFEAVAGLEQAYCDNEQATWCCDNPEACGPADDPHIPVGFCENLAEEE